MEVFMTQYSCSSTDKIGDPSSAWLCPIQSFLILAGSHQPAPDHSTPPGCQVCVHLAGRGLTLAVIIQGSGDHISTLDLLIPHLETGEDEICGVKIFAPIYLICLFHLAAPDSPDCCALILTLLSYLLILVTLPVSLCMCIKVGKRKTEIIKIFGENNLQVVQEYERAVIFRLGRLRKGPEHKR